MLQSCFRIRINQSKAKSMILPYSLMIDEEWIWYVHNMWKSTNFVVLGSTCLERFSYLFLITALIILATNFPFCLLSVIFKKVFSGTKNTTSGMCRSQKYAAVLAGCRLALCLISFRPSALASTVSVVTLSRCCSAVKPQP